MQYVRTNNQFSWSFYRTMSSKRKSPPTKLEGATGIEEVVPLPPAIIGGGSDGGGLTDLDETSSNNLSDLGEEDATTMLNASNTFYKQHSDTSSPSVSGSEVDDGIEDDRSPPNKKQRVIATDNNTNNIQHNNNNSPIVVHGGLTVTGSGVVSGVVEQMRKDNNDSRRRNSSECSSPTSDLKTNLHYNNNNSSLHNNNSSSHPCKRSMDDVLKRLTSKMNNSTIKEENRRPTPSSTPNSTHNS